MTANEPLLRKEAEAKAEEWETDKHEAIEWSAACLIEQQAAQIERMRAALVESRSLITAQEKILRHILNLAAQPRSADEAAAFARLHAALRMIDEAMGDANDR